MNNELDIILPYDYIKPTQKDVETGKNYVLRRESAVRGISSLVDSLLKDAAEEITKLCYQYNVNPNTFKISSSYNEKLFEQIGQILDNLEDDIIELTLDYSTRCTESEKRKGLLLPWILSLGRGNRNLKQTLERRLWSFSRDLEAMIVATRLAKYDISKAITRIKSSLYAVYSMPEIVAAFKQSTKTHATYIKTNGVKSGNVGSSNSEANNIDRFARTTVQMSWMRNQKINYEERGAVGYAVFRGSSYPCDLCDSRVGWHPIEDNDSFPPQHPSCVCWTVPIFKTQ